MNNEIVVVKKLLPRIQQSQNCCCQEIIAQNSAIPNEIAMMTPACYYSKFVFQIKAFK